MKVPSFSELLMAPFATTVEVFLRKSFGCRYWSFSRFISGMVVIGLFRLVYGLSEFGQSLLSGLVGSQASQNVNWIYGVWLSFLLFGCYHFILQSYHEAIGKKVLSTSMGESRLFGVGKILLALVNRMTNLLLKLTLPYLPTQHRDHLEKTPFHFTDYRGFTYRIVEPLCILLLSQFFALISGLVSFWLLVSSIMLALHSSLNLSKERSWILDKRDEEILKTTYPDQWQNGLKDTSTSIERQADSVFSTSKS